MNSIEQMRWAKELISEKTNGFMELKVGNMHDDLFIRASDKAMVGLYLSVLPNMKTQKYDCIFKGYTRCSGGYNDSKKMQKLTEEYQSVTDVLKQLEKAKISLTEDELQCFVAELKSAEEQNNDPNDGNIGEETYMYHTKNEDIHELDELVIPNCLLEAAELSENCGFGYSVYSGAIIIGGIDPIAIVPPALIELFDDLESAMRQSARF